MARPQKNKVEYFPHPVTHGKKMSYMEKKYGNDGYAVWFKILEEMGNTDFHYLDLSDEVQMMFLSDRCLVDEIVLERIIDDLVKLREFDKELWTENRILFNEKFVESIKDAYKKRSNECIDKNSLILLLESLGIRKPLKSNQKPLKSKSEGPLKPQTKEEKSKEEKTKGENGKKSSRFSPPSMGEVYFYMIEKNLPKETAKVESQKFVNFYESKNWYVGKNKMSKWKSSVSVWISRMDVVSTKQNQKEGIYKNMKTI